MPAIWLSVTSRYICEVSLAEINIWIGRINKAHPPSRLPSLPMCGSSSKPLKAWTKRKGDGRMNSLAWLGHQSSPAFHLLVLRPSDLDRTAPLAFLGFQCPDSRLWHFCLRNHMNQFLLINYVFIYNIYTGNKMLYYILIKMYYNICIIIYCMTKYIINL